jgi:hypothetical protein
MKLRKQTRNEPGPQTYPYFDGRLQALELPRHCLLSCVFLGLVCLSKQTTRSETHRHTSSSSVNRIPSYPSLSRAIEFRALAQRVGRGAFILDPNWIPDQPSIDGVERDPLVSALLIMPDIPLFEEVLNMWGLALLVPPLPV